MFKIIKYALAACAVAATFGVALNNLANVRDVSFDTAYHTTQVAELSRLETEMLHFRTKAAGFFRADKSLTKDDVQLAFDILWSRVNTELSPLITKSVKAASKHRSVLEALTADLKDIDATVTDFAPGDLAAWTKIETTLGQTEARVTLMTNDAYEELYTNATNTNTSQLKALDGAQQLMQVLVASILAGTAILLLQLRRGERRYFSLAEQEAEVRKQATIDPLTLLKNRRHFDERLQAIDQGTWRGNLQAMMIDLDGFKTINDTHGHYAGDHLLRAVALRLQDVIPANSLLARLGGDEFAVILESNNPGAVARSIIEALSAPVPFGHRLLKINASIGIASLKSGPSPSGTLLREADVALYTAKAKGKGRAVHFKDLPLRHPVVSARKAMRAAAAH